MVSTYLEIHIHKAAASNQVVLESSYGHDYSSYLFGTVAVNGITYWNYYDPLTGALMRQLANAQSARLIDGTVLAFGASNGYVYRWNMSNVVNNNWLTGITWNVSLPKPLLRPEEQSYRHSLSLQYHKMRLRLWYITITSIGVITQQPALHYGTLT